MDQERDKDTSWVNVVVNVVLGSLEKEVECDSEGSFEVDMVTVDVCVRLWDLVCDSDRE